MPGPCAPRRRPAWRGRWRCSCCAGCRAACRPVPRGLRVAAPAGAPAAAASQVVADGLDHPWDVAQAPDGTLLVDERGGGFTAVLPGRHAPRRCGADFGDLFARGETGPDGAGPRPRLRRQPPLLHLPGRAGGRLPRSIAVIAWTVDARTGARPPASPIRCSAASRSTGAPAGTAGAGCGSTPPGRCWSARATTPSAANPQDPSRWRARCCGRPATGRPAAGNPFATASTGSPYVWTYGHRNVQGLAVRPGTGRCSPWSRAPSATTR